MKKRAGQSTAELLAALRAERAKTLATLRAIPADGWNIIGVHERGHLKDMRAVLAEIL